MKNKIILALIIILTLTFVFSCAADDAETNNNGDSRLKENENNNEPGAADERADSVVIYTDDLGEFDFGGREFSMFTRLNPRYTSSINVEEQIGEHFHDAMYTRNRKLEERFNFTFSELMAEDLIQATNNARKIVLSGDHQYDIITLTTAGSLPLVQEGLMHPISLLPHINIDKPYWNRQLNSDLTVLNKKYFIHGAHDLSTYDMTHVMLFNKAMVQDLGMDNPYELVNTGKWTFDKFAEMSKMVISDLNGDGRFDENDRYGLIIPSHYPLPNFWIAAGVKSIEKDENDIPYSAMGEQKFIDVFQKTFEITWDINHDSWFGVNLSDLEPIFVTMFENGQGLFLNSTFYYINGLRGMETDFGILPYPKYTESQENYYSRIENSTSALVPVTADNAVLERASVILEALACESLNTVIPAYYDITLKVKNVRDEESGEMLDIIFANRVIDWGDAVWFADIRNGTFQPMFAANNRNLVSRLERMENIVKKLSDNAVETFEKLD